MTFQSNPENGISPERIIWHLEYASQGGAHFPVCPRRLFVTLVGTSPGASTRRTIGVFSLYFRSLTLPASSFTRRMKTGRVLWGLGNILAKSGGLMHDNTSTTVDAAVRRHGGEAATVVSNY